jgi:hypothetical protein
MKIAGKFSILVLFSVFFLATRAFAFPVPNSDVGVYIESAQTHVTTTETNTSETMNIKQMYEDSILKGVPGLISSFANGDYMGFLTNMGMENAKLFMEGYKKRMNEKKQAKKKTDQEAKKKKEADEAARAATNAARETARKNRQEKARKFLSFGKKKKKNDSAGS